MYHTRKIDAASVILALNKFISLFAAPIRIVVDQGRCFASTDFKQFCQIHQIDLHFIATGAPRGNAQVERVMSVLTNMLTATELGERSWQEAIPDIQLAINSTLNRVTRSSPLELLIGKIGRPLNVVIPAESITGTENIDVQVRRELAAQNMVKVASYDKSRYDRRKAKVKQLSKGDLVFIQNEPRNQQKLNPKFRGPQKIIEVLEHDRYLLKSLTNNRTCKYPHDKIRLAPKPSVNDSLETTDHNSNSDDEHNE